MSGFRYRCCEHCKEDIVHAVEVDDHDVPCSIHECVGRRLRLAAPSSLDAAESGETS